MEKRKHLQSALAFVQQGKLDHAISEYEAILRRDPSNCNVLNALGDLCARIGNKTEAIAYFSRLGEIYRKDTLYERAIAVYKKVLRLDPLHVDASLACGELYIEQGLIAEAKLQFQGLADHYLKKGNLSRVLAIYEKMIRMDPGNGSILSRVAGILARPGRMDEALTGLSDLGKRLASMGQAEDGRQIFERAAEVLRSQGRGAEAARFEDQINTLQTAQPEARTDGAAAAPMSEGGDSLERAETELVVKETVPLEIFPGSSVEQEELPVLERTLPDLEPSEEFGRRSDREPEGVKSSHQEAQSSMEILEEAESQAAPEDVVDLAMISFGEEAEAGEETEPIAIELDPAGDSEGLAAVGEEASAAIEPGGPQTTLEELKEAKFYLKQGMLQEARIIFQRILLRDPGHPLAREHLTEIERLLGPSTGEESVPRVQAPSIFRVVEAKPPQGEYVDFAGELHQELTREEISVPVEQDPEVKKMLQQLEQGIRDQLDVTDYETHYNLGIAYKDLELYDQAIEELRLAANDATYRVRCASLLGLCFLAKGEPARAVEELLKGLAATKAGTEERWGGLYDLATAYEALGDTQKALESLLAIHGEAPKFRDVRVRVRELRDHLGPRRESTH